MKKTWKWLKKGIIGTLLVLSLACFTLPVLAEEGDEDSTPTPDIAIEVVTLNTQGDTAVKPQFGYDNDPVFKSHIITISGIVLLMAGLYILGTTTKKALHY